jgi:hypothetical protein
MYFVKSLLCYLQLLQLLGRNQLAADPGKVLNALSKQEEFRFHSHVIFTRLGSCPFAQGIQLQLCLVIPSRENWYPFDLSHVLIKPKYQRCDRDYGLRPVGACSTNEPPSSNFILLSRTPGIVVMFSTTHLLEVASEWRNE